jgi:hypothetical protein
MDIYLILSILTMPLAIWRISNMLADTDQSGPLGILNWIRMKVGIKYDYYSEPEFKPGSIAAGILCVQCSSLWFGILFAILLIVNYKVTFFASLPFALSAVAIFMEGWRRV